MPEYDMLQFATDEDSRNILDRSMIGQPEDQWPPPERIWLVMFEDEVTIGVFVEEELERMAERLTSEESARHAPGPLDEMLDRLTITEFARKSFSALDKRADHVLRGAVYLPA